MLSAREGSGTGDSRPGGKIGMIPAHTCVQALNRCGLLWYATDSGDHKASRFYVDGKTGRFLGKLAGK